MTEHDSPKVAAVWAVALVVVTGAVLAALDWAVLVLHGLTYGMAQVIGTSELSPPDTDRYGWALAVGVVVDVVAAAAVLWLLRHAAVQWPSWATALLAAAVGGVVAAGALLAVLGINPLDVLPFR